MNPKSKFSLLSRHSLQIALAFFLVSLVVGIYFAFNPFPAGPGIQVAANPASNQVIARPATSAIQRLYVGQGYVLETGPQGVKIIAPGVRPEAARVTDRLYVGLGYVLEKSSQGIKLIGPGSP